MPVRIDAHQHFWNPSRGDYHWMPKGDRVLDRPWLPDDLLPSLEQSGISRTVLVQAAPTVNETEYMLGIADVTPSVAGVVGWVDFENRNEILQLERLRDHPKICGIRPMIQEIADVDWMLRDDVQWAFAALRDLDLTFDAAGFPHHLPNFMIILSRYPDMRTVIDHCMKPQIRDQMDGKDAFSAWAEAMKRIADETGAFCKLSGLVTEAHENWETADIRPFAEHVLESFQPERVMWGSDWPVCQLRSSYERWHETAVQICATLEDHHKNRIFGETANEFYQLGL
jgi:L-fucono-1,5-lactonase